MENVLRLIEYNKSKFLHWCGDISSRYNKPLSNEEIQVIVLYWLSNKVLNFIDLNPLECQDQTYTTIFLKMCENKTLFSKIFPFDYFEKCQIDEITNLVEEVKRNEFKNSLNRELIFSMIYCNGIGFRVESSIFL